MPMHTHSRNCEGHARSTPRCYCRYDTAIRLNPDDATAYYNRGNAKIKLGQHFDAITDFDTAIRLNPDDAEAYLNRGIAKALLNRISEAKRDGRTALRLAKQAGDTRLITHIEENLRLLEGSN